MILFIYLFISVTDVGAYVQSSMPAVTVLTAPVVDGDLSVYSAQLVFTDSAILKLVGYI